jgi:hypothetical protein
VDAFCACVAELVVATARTMASYPLGCGSAIGVNPAFAPRFFQVYPRIEHVRQDIAFGELPNDIATRKLRKSGAARLGSVEMTLMSSTSAWPARFARRGRNI